ncbi:hypothetical protein KIN34_09270 [Cellulomonas sp. DKR-3]|uniref:Uncharacterized protein n=1 Tax=Cellulomonas fulva TaxID=2835530 RepID=A0ABS5TZD3_9CELL|nr:hypothetical protein [Cellulomonas fulva]MBT0994475.1 hypothetical protein [Cellulomonas fulva]
MKITMIARSSAVLPSRRLAPTFLELKGRTVPAAWSVSIGGFGTRHGVTTTDRSVDRTPPV